MAKEKKGLKIIIAILSEITIYIPGIMEERCSDTK